MENIGAASPSSHFAVATLAQTNMIISMASAHEALWDITAPELSQNSQMYRALWNGLMSIIRRVHPAINDDVAFRIWKQFRDHSVEDQRRQAEAQQCPDS